MQRKLTSIGRLVVGLCPLLSYMFVLSRPPSAFIPPGLENFTVKVFHTFLSPQFLFYIMFLIGLLILIKASEVFCSNVYFIPLNVSLNMLSRRHKNNINSLIPVIVYSIYFLLCLSNKGASLYIFSYMNLDSLCFHFWTCTIF